jgi:hypothetical protein
MLLSLRLIGVLLFQVGDIIIITIQNKFLE